MSTASDITHSVIRYWQHGLWYNQFNKLLITEDENFHFIDIADFLKGNTLRTFPQSELVWVAPFVGQQKNNHYWVPLWIPGVIQENKLCLTHQAMPWLAPAHCDALFGQSPFLEQIHCFDDWLRFEWLTPENRIAFETWQEVFEACHALFDELSDNQWQKRLVSMDISLLTQVLVVPNVCKFSSIEAPSLLLQAYADVGESCPKAQFDVAQLIDSAKILSGQFLHDSLSINEYTAASHAMMLEAGECIAIKSPPGSAPEKIISTIIASHFVQSTLKQKSLPSIYLFTPFQSSNKWTIPAIEPSHSDVKNLQNSYEAYLKGLDLARACLLFQQQEQTQFSEVEVETQIEALRQQDEFLEERVALLEKMQREWREKTKKRFWSWLFPRKKLTLQERKALSQILEQKILDPRKIEVLFIEKGRQIKVQRTKTHQALTELVEFSALRKGALSRWLEWLAQHVSVSFASEALISQLCAMQTVFGKKLFRLVASEKERSALSEATKPCMGLLKFNWEQFTWQVVQQLDSVADLLIVDQANRIFPQQMLPLLAKGQRAIFFGDNQDISTTPLMSAVPEEWMLSAYGLDSEEIIEQLQYKGMLLGTGNAFSVALANSTYQQLLEHGIYSPMLSIHSKIKQNLKYYSLMVQGESEFKANMLINVQEATAIATWLSRDLLQWSLDKTAIVTPFQAQKEVILHELQIKNLCCEVITFYELTDKQWVNIIFSPVYTRQDKRPFVFDQGDHLVYSVIARAIENLWVIGDLTIFDPKTHSPSGNLAKKLMLKECELSNK